MSDKLSDKIARSAEPPTKGNRIVYDDAVKGFGLRITAGGSRAFVLNYRRRSDGVERRYTIGSFPDWSVAGARDEARRLKRAIDGGADPVGEHREIRDAATINDLCDKFLADYVPKRRPTTARDYGYQIASDIRPLLGRLKIDGVTFKMVDDWHRKVTARAPIRANRALGVLSRMFTMATKWGLRTGPNPCKGVERNPENKRRRYLNPDELVRLSAALDAHPNREAVDAIRLLLLTGARCGEMLTARWDDIDLRTGVWTKPGATTKQKTVHSVPLSAPARQLLADRSRESEFVFPGRASSGHRVDLTSTWKAVCKSAGLKDLRLHDLRHSYASQLASAGIGLHVIGALLGHTQPQTTHRYAHLFDDPLRAATEKAGAIITGQPIADVVPLKGAR